jgi:hypothetical protein
MPCTSATRFFAGLSNRLRNPLLFQALVPEIAGMRRINRDSRLFRLAFLCL